eukprot:CAMPEP_0171293620 /NCGR_PEP_ID=MMETSP0816-20121228/1921_1 /TAXON_ID=420281 /ORGANISM="Proboscia inermis, Strain CCAP1064/1" /LENGTH=282 /DNA_ID=CAMNT_0011764679 /DNA_START=686 /DNA_END=1534 /DNA_ORIENTATION=-
MNEQKTSEQINALNKAGHGLHLCPNTPFHTYTHSSKLLNLVNELGWIDPVVPQSMYICKPPNGIGSEVTSHQDSTFLYTTPKQTCLGLWLALDDATLENGCLWVRQRSHFEPLRRKFSRNPEYFSKTVAGSDAQTTGTTTHTDEGTTSSPPPPQMLFEDCVDTPLPPNHGETTDEHQSVGSSSTAASQHAVVTWEGSLPEKSWPLPCTGLFESGFIPVEVKAGDLVVFPGRLDHLSLPNYSTAQRHTFQLHLVEGPDAGIIWDAGNWLQYPKGMEFARMREG